MWEGIKQGQPLANTRALKKAAKADQHVQSASICDFSGRVCGAHEVGAAAAGRSHLNVGNLQRRGST